MYLNLLATVCVRTDDDTAMSSRVRARVFRIKIRVFLAVVDGD
jgi:hypothetical protein